MGRRMAEIPDSFQALVLEHLRDLKDEVKEVKESVHDIGSATKVQEGRLDAHSKALAEMRSKHEDLRKDLQKHKDRYLVFSTRVLTWGTAAMLVLEALGGVFSQLVSNLKP